jgi:two-component system, cell cycle sensor histidine kinase and response regulator CckA
MEVMGYDVLTATSGEEAIDIYKDNRHHIDLVLLDIIMPNMSGEETFVKLREINPKIRVLVATGYSLAQKADELRKLGCKGFIQKPFQMSALSMKIKELITVNR